MIAFGTNDTKSLVREMWQTVFADSDEFADIYFEQKYKNENTLIYFDEENHPAASLQMWEYDYSFYGQQIPVYYMAGLATYEQYRRKKYMSQLIEEAHRIMKERNIVLAILIPAEEWLFDFYEQYGYGHVFNESAESFSLKELAAMDFESSFNQFDQLFNTSDFTVLKNKEQYKTILEEQKLTNYERKTNLHLSGMARIISIEPLLRIYAKNNPSKYFTIKVSGDTHLRENNTFYTIEDGIVSKFPHAIADYTINILDLCELLMGKHSERYAMELIAAFPKHDPTMNFMLE